MRAMVRVELEVKSSGQLDDVDKVLLTLKQLLLGTFITSTFFMEDGKFDMTQNNSVCVNHFQIVSSTLHCIMMCGSTLYVGMVPKNGGHIKSAQMTLRKCLR